MFFWTVYVLLAFTARGSIWGPGLTGIVIVVTALHLWNFSLDIPCLVRSLLLLFHWGEFVLVTSSFDGFLFNNTVLLPIFMVMAVVESHYTPVRPCFAGFSLALSGLFLRWVAIATAGRSFSHDSEKLPPQLVTTGVYATVRHPSYLGWFMFTLGVHLLLPAPGVGVIAVLVTLAFFSQRVEHEERLLDITFGERHRCYKKRVVSGLPLMHWPLLRFRPNSEQGSVEES
ncbi:MAG: hypothetical protein KVP17_005299 [Porospora cf. gigantea B]|uniref:uncharacterized protein n=1 Tax=Porospora cf. gigantea B TaxID=2853592 RepID=UPI003571DE38|nr:MAG: hypothetical protein KVP17_005299 [Porospora cf. gigantea B]